MHIRVCACVYIYIYIHICIYACVCIHMFVCTFEFFDVCMPALGSNSINTANMHCYMQKKMPRSTVRGPHPRPQQFLRIRYRFVNEAGYWFNIDNRNDFEPQFCPGGLQFGGVILRDLDGHTWAWYANDIDEPQFLDRWIWFPQGLFAAYFWPDGRPARIPLPA